MTSSSYYILATTEYALSSSLKFLSSYTHQAIKGFVWLAFRMLYEPNQLWLIYINAMQRIYSLGHCEISEYRFLILQTSPLLLLLTKVILFTYFVNVLCTY